MNRIAVALLAFLAVGVGSAQAQALDSLRIEANRSRGFIRGAETQLGKVLALIERIETHPDGTVDTIFVGDTIYADDLVPDSAPPEWAEPEGPADSTSPPWVGDGNRIYTYFAWGDSATSWDGDTLRIAVPRDRLITHVWPVFQRGETLWLPSKDGWRPATVHPSRPWVCLPAGEAESYSFRERVIVAGMELGLKVADWTIGVDSTFAKGLDRLPPDCATDPDDGGPSSGEPGYAVLFNGAVSPGFFTRGDTLRIELRVPGTGVPDSVIFRIGAERVRERSRPYDWKGTGGFYVVPAADSLIFDWRVYGWGASSGTVRAPIRP